MPIKNKCLSHDPQVQKYQLIKRGPMGDLLGGKT